MARKPIGALSARARLTIAAGLTTLIALAGGSASFALWSATSSVTSTSSSASVGVAHALTGSSLAVTYNSTATTAVGVVTVTNSSTRAGTYTVSISATSTSPTVRSAVKVEIGTAPSCTDSAVLNAAQIGTFDAPVTISGSIGAGSTAALCLRTSMLAPDITANQSAALAASVASSVAIGTWGATASAAITFSQSVAAPSGINGSAWYWVKSTLNSSLCLESLNGALIDGTPVTQGACEGTNATTMVASELWHFVATDSGYYRVASKAVPTLWMAAANASQGAAIVLSGGTNGQSEWLPTLNGDGTFSFAMRSAGGNRCIEIPGASTTAPTDIALATCSATASQKFTVAMLENVAPATVIASCTANGTTASYSWPQLAGYQGDVTYRVYINSILVSPHVGGIGTDTTVQFQYPITSSATYGTGSWPVLVQHSANSGPWVDTTVGTLVLAATSPYLTCG